MIYWQRLLAMLLMIVTLTLGFPMITQGETYGEYTYTVENGEITITEYSGKEEHLEIPSAIEGLPVTAIGQYAFKDRNRLVSVTIPESVTELDWRGFYEPLAGRPFTGVQLFLKSTCRIRLPTLGKLPLKTLPIIKIRTIGKMMFCMWAIILWMQKTRCIGNIP